MPDKPDKKTISEVMAVLGRRGGKARLTKLSAARRREIARLGGKARHAKAARGGK